MDAIENKVESEAAQNMMGGNQQQGGGSGLDGMINSGTFSLFLFTVNIVTARAEGYEFMS